MRGGLEDRRTGGFGVGLALASLLAFAPACLAQEDAVRSDGIDGSPGIPDAPLRITRLPAPASPPARRRSGGPKAAEAVPVVQRSR